MTELAAVSADVQAAGTLMLVCTACGKDKPDAEFNINRSAVHRRGRHTQCKLCFSARRESSGAVQGAGVASASVSSPPSDKTLVCTACGREKPDELFFRNAVEVSRRCRERRCKECRTGKSDSDRVSRAVRGTGVRRTGRRRPDELATRRAAKRDQARASGKSVRALDLELKYRAMLSAVPGRDVVNVPMLDRASRAVLLMSELGELDPVAAAHMMPAQRCREYADATPDWWQIFTAECESRRAAETPELEPLHLKSDVVYLVVGRKNPG